MSVPKTLEIPEGVEVSRVRTVRAEHAVHRIRAVGDRIGSILLVPGWTGSKEDFTPVLPLLAALGFDVVTYDQRGQYESPGDAADDYSLEALADDALALADAALEDERFHLLGHSFGGLVSQTLTIEHPERIRTLSLLCTGPGALGDTPTRPLQRLVTAIGKVPLLQIHELREQGIKRPAQVTAFLAKRFTANAPASLKAMTQHLLDAEDRVDEVAATGVPCWVARGETDDAWPHDAQADMAKRLGTEIVILPSAAHSPAVEAPDELVDDWRDFLLAH
ncbi:alpha/beta hydrolase [Aeromicrobium flavum]|uniref:Alpha/beta hydrolase n=1 Tax=Aeromicrobium flavum TaxID=416568 RepID=A0A512HUY6_9ACTN|nr:alpha/beta hydrolase [Aeromicrobium flavum]GEO89269.1 alpha/beta hydrolase [Aeromicrobium flavum]